MEGLTPKKDYNMAVDVKKPNDLKIHFDGLRNFNHKKLTVEVSDVKGIYDLEGNMMHENKAEFIIENYIKFSEKAKNFMSGLGVVCKILQFQLVFKVLANCPISIPLNLVVPALFDEEY